MKITPVDIGHKSFNKKMFGLDEAEVYDFLTQVANQLEDVIRERNSLKEIVREKDLQIADFKEKDQILKSTIATASHMSERLRMDTEREAKLIIADAQQKAEILMRDSRDSLKKLYSEMNDLKKARLQFEANMKALAQAHLNLLEQGEKFMPSFQFNNSSLDIADNSSQPSVRNSSISPLYTNSNV